jgi:hypothetical protein
MICAPAGGAGALRMAVIAVDEPLERSFDGLIDKADIEVLLA